MARCPECTCCITGECPNFGINPANFQTDCEICEFSEVGEGTTFCSKLKKNYGRYDDVRDCACFELQGENECATCEYADVTEIEGAYCCRKLNHFYVFWDKVRNCIHYKEERKNG